MNCRRSFKNSRSSTTSDEAEAEPRSNQSSQNAKNLRHQKNKINWTSSSDTFGSHNLLNVHVPPHTTSNS